MGAVGRPIFWGGFQFVDCHNMTKRKKIRGDALVDFKSLSSMSTAGTEPLGAFMIYIGSVYFIILQCIYNSACCSISHARYSHIYIMRY